MAPIEARRREDSKPRRPSFSGFRVFVFSGFVFSCVLAVALAAAPGAIRVESLSGGAVDPFQAPSGTKAIVFLFTSTDCPISNRYAPEVRRLAEKFMRQGVVFRLVYPNPADGRHDILQHMTAFSYTGVTEPLR